MTTLASPHASVHEAVKRRVRSQLGRRWPVGSCLPPIRELARELDAGETSTYRAMRDLASEGWLVSRRGQGTYVMRAADDLGDLSPAARSRVRLVQFVYARPTPDAFLSNMMGWLETELTGHGLQTTRSYIDSTLQPLPMDLPGDAVVAINPGPVTLKVRDDQVLLVISMQANVVIDRVDRYDVVGVDQYQGGLLAGQCLRDAGVRDLFFIGACLNNDPTRQRPTSQQRFEGVQAGFGRTIPPRHIFLQPYTSQFLGVQAARHYLGMNDRPDGVFAITDDAACSFQIGLLTHGLSPGRDFQIVGFDGHEQSQVVGGGPITTVAAPMQQMALRGAKLLRARLADPAAPATRVFLGCSLLQGATTRRTPSP